MSLEPCTYGGFASDKSAWKRADLVVLWGCNPAASELLNWKWIRDNMNKRGAKLIVIDPRFCEAAQYADLFLQIRPGTDSVLALGMISIIINEDLYDHEFVEKWCYGFGSQKSAQKNIHFQKFPKSHGFLKRKSRQRPILEQINK